MRTHPARRSQRGFTLIEILIVVVILGILAAIVIPQFTSASEDAQTSSVQSQLQTVRSQIELYRVQNGGYPDFDQQWDDLLDPPDTAPQDRYLQSEPRNAMRGNETGVVQGTDEPSGDPDNPQAATGASAEHGWYWNTDSSIMYAIDGDDNLVEW